MAKKNNRSPIRTNTTYKSRFEEQFACLLHKLGLDFAYEEGQVEYILTHFYKPDWKIGKANYVIETKGIFDQEDRRKHLAIKKQHPELDIRFVFYADNKLYKGAKSRYSDWCKKHGFKYSVGLGIPEEWLFELDGDQDDGNEIELPKNKKHKKVHR